MLGSNISDAAARPSVARRACLFSAMDRAMTRPDKPAAWNSATGIGQPIPRMEDPKLLRGRGQYTDDIDLPGQVYAAIIRSGYAHGIIRKIDPAAALKMRGVLAVYTGADLREY